MAAERLMQKPIKAMLGNAAGCAVRVADASERLLVGEGIETGLSAMQATGIPARAAVSTLAIAGLLLRSGVREVIIVADDKNGAGERAARAAADRWLAEGRRVRIAMPPASDTDFDDLLVGGAEAPVAGGCNV
jgi:putative DNA primase/helicase